MIVAPSLDLATNVSGVSAVTNFIIDHNKECEYTHFLQGKSDGESGALKRIVRIWRNYRKWIFDVNVMASPDPIPEQSSPTRSLSEGGGKVDVLRKRSDQGRADVDVSVLRKRSDQGRADVDVHVDVNRIIHYNFPLDAFSIVRDYFFMRVAYRRRKRMVIHVHGGLYLFKEQKPWVIRHLLNEVFSWDCPFIVLSNREKEQIQRLYGTKNVTVLPNCVEGPEDVEASPDPIPEQSLPTRSLSEGGGMSYETRGYENVNGIDMLYLGRIEKNKGMDYLLEAMRELKAKGAQLTLHFAGIEQGKNGYIGRFQELLGDRFVYEGVVAGDQKAALFRRCQVFVLPSLYEGLPISLLETMSHGLVPVVTDVGSITEYVDDGVNGLLIKTKDTASIITAVDRLLHDRATLQKMSAAARQTIVTRLQPAKYIEQLNRIYSSIP